MVRMVFHRKDISALRYLRPFAILLLLSTTALIVRAEASDAAPRPRYPDQDIGADTLPARKKAQLKTVNQFKVFYQFQFTDKLNESGITFGQRGCGRGRRWGWT
jgi:hypothetical protein